MKRWLMLCMMVLCCGAAGADEVAQQQRELELAAKLRCLVCQNQSIAESHAPLALDLRQQIREQMSAGRSDREILDFMTARYGDFVLYEPPVKPATLALWLGPLLLLLLGVLIAWRVTAVRRRLTTGTLTSEEQARAAQLLSGSASNNSGTRSQ